MDVGAAEQTDHILSDLIAGLLQGLAYGQHVGQVLLVDLLVA